MKDGFIKVGAATIEISVANPDKNKINIVKAVKSACKKGVKLLVMPELCITGYTCSDLFFLSALRESAMNALAYIAEKTALCDITFAVGLPISYASKLYNCAAVVSRGNIIGIVPKCNIPNYSEFYESRHFSSGSEIADGTTINLFGKDIPFGKGLVFASDRCENFRFGVEICEDLWVPDTPSTDLCKKGANIILNLSASDEVIGKADYRRTLVSSTSARLVCGYVYADASFTESTQDMVFSSHHIIAENGTVLSENEPFSENSLVTSEIDVERIAAERRRMTTYKENPCRFIPFSHNTDHTSLTRSVDKNPFVPADNKKISERCDLILKIQSHGLRRRIMHTNARKIVIGVSGGLDSTLALLVMVRAMDMLKRDRSDIIAVTMPCFGTTGRTRSNAEVLCSQFGVTFTEVPIASAVKQHFNDIGQDADVHDITYENGQARERTQILMDIANKENGMVIGTGDLSELALGWCTYNGDHMSMYGVNSSIPKTLVRYLVKYEADTALADGKNELSDVLYDILDTPVSPELLPPKDGEIQQKTEDIIGPYELHDFFLYYTVRFGYTDKKIFRLAKYAYNGLYDDDTIRRWLDTFMRRFFSHQFKRSCMPDGVKVGSVTLSPRGDWRMPSDADSQCFRTVFNME